MQKTSKSVYEILDHVEYLGHTKTAKSITVNYHLHKVRYTPAQSPQEVA